MNVRRTHRSRLLRPGGLREFARSPPRPRRSAGREPRAAGAAVFIAIGRAAIAASRRRRATLLPQGRRDTTIPAPLLVSPTCASSVAGIVDAHDGRRSASSTRATNGAKASTSSRCPRRPPSITCEMRIGERRVEGRSRSARKRAQAYEQAKQRRPQGGAASSRSARTCSRRAWRRSARTRRSSSQIEYQETLRYDAGAFSLRFPMAITPRYIPGDADSNPTPAGTGWSPTPTAFPTHRAHAAGRRSRREATCFR